MECMHRHLSHESRVCRDGRFHACRLGNAPFEVRQLALQASLRGELRSTARAVHFFDRVGAAAFLPGFVNFPAHLFLPVGIFIF